MQMEMNGSGFPGEDRSKSSHLPDPGSQLNRDACLAIHHLIGKEKHYE